MGQKQVGLNEVGLQQAFVVGKHLSQRPFKHVFCSDLERTKQTAEQIKKSLGDVPTTYTRKLRERSFGNLEGQLYKDVRHLFLNEDGSYNTNFAPGGSGESVEEFSRRVGEALKQIRTHERWETTDNVLVVTHGGTIRYLMAKFFLPDTSNTMHFPMDVFNTSITVVEELNDPFVPFRLVMANHTCHRQEKIEDLI